MTDDERAALERVARSSVLPHRKVVRAQALVWAGDGVANEEIARRVRVDADTVRRWRARFATSGVEGIGKIAKGRGRKPWLPTDIVQRVLTATREHTPPGEETHWTTRSMAAHVGVGKDNRGSDLG
jgi:transposase